MRRAKVRALSQWDHKSLFTIGLNKEKLLTVPNASHEVFQDAHGEFKTVVNGPLRKLYRLFSQLEYLHSNLQNVPLDAEFDDIGDSDVVQTREAMAVYEKFMKTLHEPLELE
ncbi:hypothetical protein C8Q72DRAFT_879027 [Fomitopsis betulina]|nr:hypothetical protein C8Q72DRAFT_879027 [Fomitopsis betulina]